MPPALMDYAFGLTRAFLLQGNLSFGLLGQGLTASQAICHGIRVRLNRVGGWVVGRRVVGRVSRFEDEKKIY